MYAPPKYGDGEAGEEATEEVGDRISDLGQDGYAQLAYAVLLMGDIEPDGDGIEKSDSDMVVDGGDGGDLRGIVIAPAKASDGKGMCERSDSGGDVSLAVAIDGEAVEAISLQSSLLSSEGGGRCERNCGYDGSLLSRRSGNLRCVYVTELTDGIPDFREAVVDFR